MYNSFLLLNTSIIIGYVVYYIIHCYCMSLYRLVFKQRLSYDTSVSVSYLAARMTVVGCQSQYCGVLCVCPFSLASEKKRHVCLIVALTAAQTVRVHEICDKTVFQLGSVLPVSAAAISVDKVDMKH